LADADTEGVQVMTMTMAGQAVSISVNDTSGDAVKVMTLTTGADGGAAFTGESNNDIFSGAVGTLNTVDSLDGGDGSDTLNATMNGAATPTLTSVESMTITATGASTIDLLNSDSLTTVNSSSSTAALTLSNVEVGDTVNITNTTQTHTINFEGDTGTADAVTINMTSVTGAADLVVDAAIETVNMASEGTNSFETDFAGTIDLSGSGSLTLAGTGAGTVAASVLDAGDYTGALVVSMTDAAHTVTGGSAGDTITGATGTANTLTGNGGNDTITGGTGADTISAGEGNNQVATGGGADTVTAGAGNDLITGGAGAEVITAGDGANTVIAGAGNDNVTTGAGNDRIDFSTAGNLTVTDTIDPGAGTDTLVVSATDIDTNADLADDADLAALQAGMANFTAVEVGVIGTVAGTDDVMNIARLGANITTVNVTAATSNGTAALFTLNSGSTVNINVAGQGLDNAVTLNDTGTTTTDAVTLANANADDSDRFNGENLTIGGFEDITINTGATAVATQQTVGTVGITSDGTDTAVSMTLTGANALDVGVITNAGNGKLTIDASGITAQAAGTNTLTIAAPVAGTGGVEITATDGDDIISGDAGDANTLTGGTGDDNITGGSAADTITATAGDNTIDGNDGNDTITTGAGADTITGGTGNETVTTGGGADVITTDAGNDSVDAGAGNDRITAAGNLTTADTLDGGADTDTLVISAAVTAGSALNLSNFETIEYTATVTQDMFLFGSDNVIGTLVLADDANFSFSNVADTTNSIVIADTMTAANITSSRLVDGDANETTISIQTGTDAAQDLGVVTISNEETVTLNTTMDTAARVFDISGTLDAADMTSLTITGNSNVDINSITNATGLATLDSSDLTGTLVIGSLAAVVTADMTVTTGSGASTVTSGTGDDNMSAGDGAVVFTAGTGADTLTGGAGADSLSGGIGVDVLSGGGGADSLLGGTGNDNITGGAGADHFQLSASTDGTDTWVDWTDGEDLISIADALINPAGSTSGNAWVTADYEESRNTVADIAAGDTLHVIELQQAQSTAQIQTVAAAGAADAVVIVFNSDTGKAEIWYDDDWTDAAGRTQLATIDEFRILVVK
jgi:Ca2+-binding RTX toxin-like protein